MTRNITLAIDEDVLQRVRAIAIERRTSLNALVRQHLEALAQQDDEREIKRRVELAELRDMSARSALKSEAGKFTREDAYEGRLR